MDSCGLEWDQRFCSLGILSLVLLFGRIETALFINVFSKTHAFALKNWLPGGDGRAWKIKRKTEPNLPRQAGSVRKPREREFLRPLKWLNR
jgi:hypothetical protein